jgi:hypothetical protein
VRQQYQHEYPGSFRAEDLVEWALEEGLIDLPKVNRKRLLVLKARQAARASRIQDKQGRTVREVLPAKIPLKVDENGNILLFEVRYDHIHTMSADHALLSFDQRDENIKKQQRSATRDLESFLENNPHAEGRQRLFDFDFVREDAGVQVVEKVEETPRTQPMKG